MSPATWAALGGLAALLLVAFGAAVATLLAARQARARETALLAEARADVDALRARMEELSAALADARASAQAAQSPTEFVITTAGEPGADRVPQVSERAVLSVALGEPMVKLAAFGFGLRRALSPETRNRIAFEMRREVKRARKERRRAARRARTATVPTEESAA